MNMLRGKQEDWQTMLVILNTGLSSIILPDPVAVYAVLIK